MSGFLGIVCEQTLSKAVISAARQNMVMPALYGIRRTASKGAGVYALRDILTGTAIVHEENLLQCACVQDENWKYMCRPLMIAFDNLCAEQKQAVLALHDYRPSASATAQVGQAIDYMMAKRPHNDCSREQYIKLSFVMRTNTFKGASEAGQQHMDELDQSPQALLFLQTSRFNHSCDNNANHEVDAVSRVIEIRTKRNIRQGEEITINYVEPWTKDRSAKMLSIWGFACLCPICDTKDMSMDASTRARYEEAFKQLRDCDETSDQDLAHWQTLESHLVRLHAHQVLGCSNSLYQEFRNGANIYASEGLTAQLLEALQGAVATAIVGCGPLHHCTTRTIELRDEALARSLVQSS